MEGRFGGPQNRILQVSECLQKYGVDTVVVLPEQDSDIFYRKLSEKFITARRLSLHRLTREKQHLIAGVLRFVPELFSLYRCLKKEKASLAHCNGIWQFTGLLAAKMAGLKVIMHLNDTWTPWGIKLLFKILGPMCDAYILASERTLNCYFEGDAVKKKYAIIHPPVDTAYFDPETTIPDEKINRVSGVVVATIANINPTKGLEYFIYMADILMKTHKDVSFHIVGACFKSQEDYLEKLQRLIDKLQLKNVFFYGKSDNIASVLKAVDIFVCTSVSESGPMSVFEAMSMQKAVVSTNVGDVSYFIKDGESGFVVPPCNAESLAEKVGFLIKNEKARHVFGRNACLVAREKLDTKICAKKHKDLYLSVLGTCYSEDWSCVS